MFCPNCGTQNPDTAATCSKCNFNIKGAAAPKFKGTMLMMNQPIPGAPPGVGPQAPAPAPAPAAPPPSAQVPAASVPGAGVPGVPRAAGAQSAVPSKLKGTMVGVAPMSGGAAPVGPGGHAFPPTMPMAAVPHAAPAPTPAPGLGMGGAPGQAPMGGMGGAPGMSPPAQGQGAPPGYGQQQQPAPYVPPHAQAGVNPLGGTVAADGGFAQFAQQAAAAAGVGAQFGAQPQGAPPQQYGAPPGGAAYGTPPNQYGGAPQQPQGGYGGGPSGGQPPAGYGNPMAPQGGIMPYGGAAQANPMVVGTLPSSGALAGPTRRNALMTFLMPFGVMVGGMIVSIVGAIVGVGIIGLLGSLISLGGAVLNLIFLIQMAGEVKGVTGNAGFAWWPIFIPIYNLYWVLILLPQEVGKAKQMRGVQAPVRNIILYFFLTNFALASDLNDIAR